MKSVDNYIENVVLPYHRCFRPLIKRANSYDNERKYLQDIDYAQCPYLYTRSFLQIQSEMKNLFLYVEPGDKNLKTYSYHIQQLLIRICIEIEANFKAIFKENKYSKDENNWNIVDYWKINISHRLSDYQVIMPIWDGKKNVFCPFEQWKNSHSLSWYRAFQKTKHNRSTKMTYANFYNLMNAFCGLFVLLSAQFGLEDYSTGPCYHVVKGGTYFEGEFGIGNMLQIQFPNWADNERYDVDWNVQCKVNDKFRRFDYDSIDIKTLSEL